MNWIAVLSILMGYLLIVRERRMGFIVQSFGCALYIILYFAVDWSIVAVNMAFLLMNLYGFHYWNWDYKLGELRAKL